MTVLYVWTILCIFIVAYTTLLELTVYFSYNFSISNNNRPNLFKCCAFCWLSLENDRGIKLKLLYHYLNLCFLRSILLWLDDSIYWHCFNSCDWWKNTEINWLILVVPISTQNLSSYLYTQWTSTSICLFLSVYSTWAKIYMFTILSHTTLIFVYWRNTIHLTFHSFIPRFCFFSFYYSLQIPNCSQATNILRFIIPFYNLHSSLCFE